MRQAILILPLALILAACDVHTSDDNGNSVHISLSPGNFSTEVNTNGSGDHVSVNVPGFAANLNVPGLHLGTDMDMDGVKMAPNTSIKGMDVFDADKGKNDGTVHIAFTNPDAPTALVDYYKGALGNAGFTVSSSDGSGVKATKGAKTFDLALTPAGSGSSGKITITGE